jgi:CRISPR-associated endonuclease/helicase Cas3
MNIYKLLPGKTGEHNAYLPLWMHLEDTADVMAYLCEKRVPGSVIRATGLDHSSFIRICRFLALTHDIGKATPEFISKIASYNNPYWKENLCSQGLEIPEISQLTAGRRTPHALAGEVLLRSYRCPDGVCSVVGAHHGKPSDITENSYDYETQLSACYRNYFASAKQESLWKGVQNQVYQNALIKSGCSSAEELPKLSNCAQMLMCGLLIQADWIASNQTYFPLLTDENMGSETMYPERSRQALDRISLTDVWHGEIKENNSYDLFFERFGFFPNPVQKAAVDAAQNTSDPGGLLIIEAQMGVGKTEAALAVAELLAEKSECGGLFFGLPTQATSNGIFPRMAQWAERVSRDTVHSIRLVHGMAELNEDYQAFFRGKATTEEDGDAGITVNSWFSGRKQALLADFVVGTVDTALMAALKHKHVMLRHLGLCGKVVVIDECHAYDAYMSRFLLCILQWLGAYKVPVILLSATLPEEKKRQMVQAYCMPYQSIEKRKISLPESSGYPLLTWANREKVCSIPVADTSHSAKVEISLLAESELIDTLRKHLREGGCAGVIVNTVKRAQEIAETLRKQLPDKHVYVYHAQFLVEERIRREKELIKVIGKNSSTEQRSNVIVVGTQVLEQSLDIDFDYLITDLCPMDLLLQRIGRLHRHKRVRPSILHNPTCAVLQTGAELESGAIKIYGEWLLKQTLRYLPTHIQIPVDIPGLVNRVYAEPRDEEKSDPAWEHFRNRTEIKTSNADGWCLSNPKNSKRESGNSIVGLLDHYAESDKKAEASVRDGSASVDVLVMCKSTDGYMSFMPWISDSRLRGDTVPSDEEARQIALQRLRLPFMFGLGKNLDETIDTLERENSELLSPWQESPWLKGELILLLDENRERELCGYLLRYDKDNGLIYERIGE